MSRDSVACVTFSPWCESRFTISSCVTIGSRETSSRMRWCRRALGVERIFMQQLHNYAVRLAGLSTEKPMANLCSWPNTSCSSYHLKRFTLRHREHRVTPGQKGQEDLLGEARCLCASVVSYL